MIKSLILKNVATYTEKVEIEPTKINYFYGSNGSGKTTLSKVIANKSAFPDCHFTWQHEKVETLVYNKDFVERHFSQSSSIKGIFTLGKDASEAKEFIEGQKQKLETKERDLVSFRKSLETKKTEESELNEEMIEKCWSIKDRNNFKHAYTGYLGSKRVFFNKCQDEINNTSILLKEEEIKDRYSRIFSKELQVYEQIFELDISVLDSLENNYILSTKIVGKEDLPISLLITKLSNSDWIKQGLGYLDNTENQCPFCQKALENDLKTQIESIFDETYHDQIEELETYKKEYVQSILIIIDKLKKITQTNIEILDFSELQDHISLIEEKYKGNISIIDKKIQLPSSIVKLNSLLIDLEKAKQLINNYRENIQSHNLRASNIKEEKKILVSQVWRFTTNELSHDLTSYQRKMNGLKKAIKTIEDKISEKTEERKIIQQNIREKESNITDVNHTKHEINIILKSFGFTNFIISEADNGYYKTIRQDGVDAKETLSEGEYTFITFLYFYQLLKGSIEESGVAKDKIVVIDDLISSLDSNVLFIVSNLIKQIITDCHNKQNGIKQVFILTHNIYFHKEVTFLGNGKTQSQEASFWIVRNLNNKSCINRYHENPIQTTYELLWEEIRDTNKINKVTVFNTMRRILEYYFKIIGGIDYEKSIEKFEGEKKVIVKSLFSWINDGSHFINDDLLVYTELENIEKQLDIFKEIFKKLNHESHYNMMMKIDIE